MGSVLHLYLAVYLNISICSTCSGTVTEPARANKQHDNLQKFRYTYRLGHRLMNGTRVWSKSYSFKASPYPGQDSLQRVIIFGDMGKVHVSFHVYTVSIKSQIGIFVFKCTQSSDIFFYRQRQMVQMSSTTSSQVH